MERCHKKARPTTFHRCLFKCDLLLDIRKMAGLGRFISINMNADENIQRFSEPVHGKYNERLLLAIEEFIPLLKYQLLAWCHDGSAVATRKELKKSPPFMAEDGYGDFFRGATEILDHLDLLKMQTISAGAKSLAAKFRKYDLAREAALAREADLAKEAARLQGVRLT